jgi:hypothetical protein
MQLQLNLSAANVHAKERTLHAKTFKRLRKRPAAAAVAFVAARKKTTHNAFL